ncbi:MAG: S-formylglutathione hydrolase [Myxococcales bacterium]|jgi:S-formylglutathione hydrolase
METVSESRMFGGEVRFLKHRSEACDCDMQLSVFLPPSWDDGQRRPVLYWLSGLTCTADNFTTKAGAQRLAAEHGVIVVAPDTSPRGEGVADDDAYDLGQGAGFYVDATQAPWASHFRMYEYVVQELPGLVEGLLPIDAERRGIFGHSMGGHGALTIALSNPGRYRSVSAFAPVVAPTRCPWGEKAFSNYLGDDRELWTEHDACELVSQRRFDGKILIDQGLADGFLEEQLKPELFELACAAAGQPLELRRHEGYDHSYYFIATFMGDHFAHHARALAR